MTNLAEYQPTLDDRRFTYDLAASAFGGVSTPTIAKKTCANLAGNEQLLQGPVANNDTQ